MVEKRVGLPQVRAPVEQDGGTKQGINIPLRDLYNIVVFMSIALDTKVVVLGGRANNIINLEKERFTHDVDVAISHKPTVEQFAQLPLDPGRDGIYFELNGDPAAARGRVKLLYHSPAVAAIVKEGYVEIDTYYPGYVSSVNKFKPRNDVNGIPIEAILARSETYVFGNDMRFDVVSKPQFIIMKSLTSQERRAVDDHDHHDLEATIKNSFNTPELLEELVTALRAELRRYMPDIAVDVVRGVMNFIDQRDFEPVLKAAARQLAA